MLPPTLASTERPSPHAVRGTAERRAAIRRASLHRASIVALITLLFVSLAPVALRAQSGRRTQPTPTPERPRRVPPSDQRGQPVTPDAPSTNAPRPAESPRPAAGQQPSQNPDEVPTVIDEDEVYHVHSNLVPVSANVSDAAGRAVTDLKLEDFELRVDGQPKPISDLSFAETPVRMALLFDNSSSVRPTRELEKQAAVRFLRTVLRPVDQAAVFSISTYPSLDQPLTSDAAKLVRTIEAYGEVEGSTALFDTIIAAAEYLRPMPGRKVIVIVSDGAETTSKITDFGEVLRRSLAADCQVFVIQTGMSDNANLRDLFAERRMQDLTANTGGAVYPTRGAADLDPAFAHIAADLSQQYVLSYYPTDDGSDGRFRAISLRVKTRPNMRVRARRGFYPRRRTEASSLPQNFVVDVAATTAPEPEQTRQPSQPRADAPAAAAERQQVAAVTARGPLHGSKNLSPDGDDAAAARAPADARPTVRLGNSNPPAAPDGTTPEPPLSRVRTQTQASVQTQTQASAAPASPAPAEKDSTKDSTAAEPEGDSAARDGTKPDATPSTAGPPGSSERAEPKPLPQQAARPTPPAASQSSPKPASPAQSQTSTQTTQQPSAPPADAKDAKPPVSGGLLNGRATSLPRPAYPETARRMRIAGMVSVEVTIDEGGKVISARAVSGPLALRDAAVTAARRARFSQTIISGRAVQVIGVINYHFSL